MTINIKEPDVKNAKESSKAYNSQMSCKIPKLKSCIVAEKSVIRIANMTHCENIIIKSRVSYPGTRKAKDVKIYSSLQLISITLMYYCKLFAFTLVQKMKNPSPKR